jgi:hypothetical protein
MNRALRTLEQPASRFDRPEHVPTISETAAAERCGYFERGCANPVRAFQKMARRWGLPCKFVGRTRRYDPRVLEAFMERQPWTVRPSGSCKAGIWASPCPAYRRGYRGTAMSGTPKHLRDVHAATWLALVAVLTVGLVKLPSRLVQVVALSSIAGLVKLSDDQRRSKANRIRKALDICGFSLTTAARTAQMDIGDFSRMLSGGRTLDDWRLEMLGDEFMRTLALLELQDRGLPEFARTALKVQPMLTKESA